MSFFNKDPMPYKYSIIMPWYRRHREFRLTWLSYMHWYGHRDDIELIIIEDGKNATDPEAHAWLHNYMGQVTHAGWGCQIIVDPDAGGSYCTSAKYNAGALAAMGDWLILTSVEVYHACDILGQLQCEKSTYEVCACDSVHVPCEPRTYQELTQVSQFSQVYEGPGLSRLLHFCSCISKIDYLSIGGFDERFGTGIAYEDDSFRQRVLRKMHAAPRYSLQSRHVEHPRLYLQSNPQLVDINRRLYMSLEITGQW
jgi:hypothetical protein